MKRLLCVLFLSALLACSTISCTREPTKLKRNDTDTTVEADSGSTETETSSPSGGIVAGGALTDTGFGELIPPTSP